LRLSCINLRSVFFRCHTVKVTFQAHRLWIKYPFIHQTGFLYDRFKIHQGKNVFFEINAGGDLDKLQSFFCQGEDTSFSYEPHRLIAMAPPSPQSSNIFLVRRIVQSAGQCRCRKELHQGWMDKNLYLYMGALIIQQYPPERGEEGLPIQD